MSLNSNLTFDKDEENLYNSILKNEKLSNQNFISELFTEQKTKHAEDAIDYEDINELADEELADEELEEESVDKKQHSIAKSDNYESIELEEKSRGVKRKDCFDEKDNNVENEFDRNDTKKIRMSQKNKQIEMIAKKNQLKKVVASLKKKVMKKNIKYHYSSFSKKKILNFHLIFKPKPKYYSYLASQYAKKKNIKCFAPLKLNLEIANDTKSIFELKKRSNINDVEESSGICYVTEKDVDFIRTYEINMSSKDFFIEPLSYIKKDWFLNNKFKDFLNDLIFACADWDDDLILSANENTEKDFRKNADICSLDTKEDYMNDESIFEGKISNNIVKLDLNDPKMFFITENQMDSSSNCFSKNNESSNSNLNLFIFNISNDEHYEKMKSNYNSKIRSRLSNLNIEHSLPALILQYPFYKVKLTSTESRFFHRPVQSFLSSTKICFSDLKHRKKKKDRNMTIQQLFNKSYDLTLGDTGTVVALEYSEEYPLILLKFGMCSKIVNYYRVENENDLTRPKYEFGETHILGVEDKSPFWKFGEVAPGDFVPTLYNNMIRAPIFNHDLPSTIFLIVKSKSESSSQNFFLRKIDGFFCVGNLFPVLEVPPPHSRKTTNTSKNRLKAIVYRTMNKNDSTRISVKDISNHFPYQNDMQNRQRLKEFMEYQRQGEDHGYWKIKAGDIIPTEEEIRSFISPEDVALLESMQFGEKVINDTNMIFNDYLKKEEMKKERKEKNNDLNNDEVFDFKKDKERIRKPRDLDQEIDINEESASWNLTKNFLLAVQSKINLLLKDDSDPSGIGLGFSFLRSTQKKAFQPQSSNNKELNQKVYTSAYQQKIYEAELIKKWYTQRRSLVNHGSDFDYNSIYKEHKPVDHLKILKKRYSEECKKYANKVLKITRLIKDVNGIVQRKVEYLTDPRLINAYINRKKQIEDDLLKNADVSEILPTSDKELNKIRRKALELKLANLEKRAKFNNAKKIGKDSHSISANKNSS